MTAPLLLDRSDRTRLRLTGPQRVTTLNGLVTNDVAALHPGQGQYAAVLTAKGKLIADVRIFMQEDAILIDTSPRAAQGLLAVLTKFINPRFATLANISGETATLGVTGDIAAQTVAAAIDIDRHTLESLAPFAHVPHVWRDTPLTIVRASDLGAHAYDCVVNATHREALHAALQGAGATPADDATWQAYRIGLGWPAFGIDMDDTTLPQEANLDTMHAISFNKGCYVGQETVARIHFRGHVNRTLRRVALEGLDVPPSGSTLHDADDKPVGEIRSVARTAEGTVRAIAMVRREIADGVTLTLRWPGDQTAAHVLGPAIGALSSSPS